MSNVRARFAGRAIFALLCTGLFLGVAPISADDVPGTYGEAMAWYGNEAQAGNAEAQFLLAYALETGAGANLRPEEARNWYQAAAEQGHLRAQIRLGLMLAEGRGGPVDGLLARAWLDKAAHAGDVDAMSLLGFLLVAEEPGDLNAAYRWFRLASEQGDTAAAGNLAALVDMMTPTQRNAAEVALDAWLTSH